MVDLKVLFKEALSWKFTNWDLTFSIVQDVPNLVVLLFYPITVENFEKLTFEVAIFYMGSYGTAGKNESSRVFLKRDQIFDQYKTYDFKD